MHTSLNTPDISGTDKTAVCVCNREIEMRVRGRERERERIAGHAFIQSFLPWQPYCHWLTNEWLVSSV